MKKQFAAVLALSFASLPVYADRGAADACAAGLSPESQQIYHGTLANKPTPQNGRELVVAQTEKLIQEGKLTMFSARAAAQAAGKCLELAARP